jgi:hypothetical protein
MPAGRTQSKEYVCVVLLPSFIELDQEFGKYQSSAPWPPDKTGFVFVVFSYFISAVHGGRKRSSIAR